MQKANNNTSMTMASNSDEILFADYSPMYRVYNNGRVERMNVPAQVPPSLDRNTGVESKDKQIIIAPDSDNTGRGRVSVRMFNPVQNRKKKMAAVLMYCHGGGFCSGSTFSRVYHKFLNRLAFETQAIVVSVEHRKATEHPLPAAYDDCWHALMWILSHNPVNNTLPNNPTDKEPWLEPGTVDFSQVYVGGDSSGANIAHQVALRAGVEPGFGKAALIDGLVLIHPFFWGTERIGDEESKCKRIPSGAELGDKAWAAARWGTPRTTVDDPWFNPTKDPKLSSLGCRRVLICVAKEDVFRDRGLLYGCALNKSGWVGDIVVFESHGEDHAFQLRKPSSTSSKGLMTKIVGFLHNNPHSRL